MDKVCFVQRHMSLALCYSTSVVLTDRIEWERHEYGLVSGVGRVETELGTAIVHEVELDVAAAAQQLPLSLVVPVRVILVLLHCEHNISLYFILFFSRDFTRLDAEQYFHLAECLDVFFCQTTMCIRNYSMVD